MFSSYIKNKIKESLAIKQLILHDDRQINAIEKIANLCIISLQSGGKIILAGNGGSFADAQHISAEFISRFMYDRRSMASIVLGANNSSISAIGNDYGYNHVFSRELEALGREGDVFIPISTSGNSLNILKAVEQAKIQGIHTMALTGNTGGKLSGFCDCLCVPSQDTARIQECHIMIGHILCGIVESIFLEGNLINV